MILVLQASIDSLNFVMRLILAGIVITTYLLHQDYWFWRTARPLIFGFLPIGLFYHAVFCLLCSVVMMILAKLAWPAHFDEAASSLLPEDEGR